MFYRACADVVRTLLYKDCYSSDSMQPYTAGPASLSNSVVNEILVQTVNTQWWCGSNLSATGVHVGGKLWYTYTRKCGMYHGTLGAMCSMHILWERCWYTHGSYKHVGWYSRPEEAEHYEYSLFQTLQYQRCITLRHINICSWHCICISVEFPPFTHTHAQRHKHAHTCTCTHTHPPSSNDQTRDIPTDFRTYQTGCMTVHWIAGNLFYICY